MTNEKKICVGCGQEQVYVAQIDDFVCDCEPEICSECGHSVVYSVDNFAYVCKCGTFDSAGNPA